MGIGFGSGILLDLALFADRTNAEPESYLSIKWDIVYLRSRVARTTAMTGLSARPGEVLSDGCKAGLTLKEKDSFLLLPRPWSRCSGRDGSAQCPSGTHDPC